MPTIKIVPMPGVAVEGPQGPRGLQGIQGERGLTGPMGPAGDSSEKTEYAPRFGPLNQDESLWTSSNNVDAVYSSVGNLVSFQIFSESFPSPSWQYAQSWQLGIELPQNASSPSVFFGQIQQNGGSKYLIMAQVSTGQKDASLWYLSSAGTFEQVTLTSPFNLSNDTFYLSGTYFSN